MSAATVRAVLFDLDGTLIDSAPDLAAAANRMRLRRGLDVLPLESFRPMVGAGARGMLAIAFGITPEEAEFAAMREEFFDEYESDLSGRTVVFPGIAEVLGALEAAGLRWGVVTNKAERFALPVVERTGLAHPGALVCGDTTPHAKPHPAPLLEAARRLEVAPEACIYVGDDLRDVQAGRAAGMRTVAVRWGYLGQGEPIERWGADILVGDPVGLLKWLDLA
ncbi:phosphoglycolate phosphatase [Caldimonas tepidiphila]|uniref:phosphoglycolate phosphatase n=1 Tax=Caldimonas tepidiphila TaxID=2315841 RepID=UPI000E5B2775|nr:phosphoglycolate phosphatase [Caldimonas tepidiphila]